MAPGFRVDRQLHIRCHTSHCILRSCVCHLLTSTWAASVLRRMHKYMLMGYTSVFACLTPYWYNAAIWDPAGVGIFPSGIYIQPSLIYISPYGRISQTT